MAGWRRRDLQQRNAGVEDPLPEPGDVKIERGNGRVGGRLKECTDAVPVCLKTVPPDTVTAAPINRS